MNTYSVHYNNNSGRNCGLVNAKTARAAAKEFLMGFGKTLGNSNPRIAYELEAEFAASVQGELRGTVAVFKKE